MIDVIVGSGKYDTRDTPFRRFDVTQGLLEIDGRQIVYIEQQGHRGGTVVTIFGYYGGRERVVNNLYLVNVDRPVSEEDENIIRTAAGDVGLCCSINFWPVSVFEKSNRSS
ncbi:MAG: hypothetical protein ABIA21_04090 [Candidatus Aenigmatarchaeota archaeon]